MGLRITSVTPKIRFGEVDQPVLTDGAVFSRLLRWLLEQLAQAQFGERGGLADLNAPAATLCFRFALAAILWFKLRPIR